MPLLDAQKVTVRFGEAAAPEERTFPLDGLGDQDELFRILKNESVRSINGVPRAQLAQMYQECQLTALREQGVRPGQGPQDFKQARAAQKAAAIAVITKLEASGASRVLDLERAIERHQAQQMPQQQQQR